MHKRSAFLLVPFVYWMTATLVLAGQPDATIIWVSDLHCANCAAKLAGKLYTVPGVVDVKTNVKKGVVLVVPEKKRHPSPRSLWEVMEKADFTPTKLRCPTGVFVKKPTR